MRAVLVRAVESNDRAAIWPLLSLLYGLEEAQPPSFADLQVAVSAEPALAVRRYTDWARRQATPLEAGPLQVVSPDAVRVAEWLRQRVRRRAEYRPIYTDDLETLLVLAQAADVAEAAARVRVRSPDTLLLPVLLLGESGSGKELLAKALHEIHMHAYEQAKGAAARKDSPGAIFGPINCGGLPANLVESELFGHIKGAFTSSVSSREGIIKRCREGTVFLDEIGDTPIEVQLRLLRFLNDGEVRPVGRDEPEYHFPWVIAATHRDLSRSVAEGKFREDLLNRLNGHAFYLKPLRLRGDDALGALEACIERHAGRKLSVAISIPAERALRSDPWAGNLRAVDQLARRIVQEREVRGDHLSVDIGDLPPSTQQSYLESRPYADVLADQYAEESRMLDQEERAAMRESLVRHFVEVSGVMVPEVRFCRTVAKLATADLVRGLFDDPKEHEKLVRAVAALAVRTASHHERAFREALCAIDGTAPPPRDVDVEIVEQLPSWLRKVLSLIEGLAGNPEFAAPLRNLEAWLDRLPAPVRIVVMDLVSALAEAVRAGENGEDDEAEEVIDVRDVDPDAMHWKDLKKDKAAFEKRLQKAGSIAALARELRLDPKTVSKAADRLGVARTRAGKKSG